MTTNIQIYTDQGLRFVGHLAEKRSRITWNPQTETKSDHTIHTLALAGLSLLGLHDGAKIKIVTGLPIAWDSPQARQRYRQILLGQHLIQTPDQTYTVEIQDVIVGIQPSGSVCSLIWDHTGKIKAKNTPYLTHPLAVLDIGMGTSDYAEFDANLEYLARGSRSTDKAMGQLLDLFIEEALTQFGRQLSRHDAADIIQANALRIGKQTYPVADIVEPLAIAVADQIKSDIPKSWTQDINRFYDTVITGGGASLLGPYMLDIFPDPTILDDNANPIGFHHLGRGARWPQPTAIVVGLDIGNGYTKITGDGQTVHKFPSIIGYPEDLNRAELSTPENASALNGRK